MAAGFVFAEGETQPQLRTDNGEASISTGPARWAGRSLQWTWHAGGGVLRINSPVGFEFRSADATSNALATFMVWIYNADPRPEPLRVNFRRGEGPVDAWFDYQLDFSGWRACWIPFERDMQGTPHPDMDRIEFVTTGGSGELRFDLLVTSTWLDSRHATPDYQQPNVFDPKRGPLGIWDGLMHFHQWERAALADAAPTPVSADVLEGLIERLELALGLDARKPFGIDNLTTRHAEWFPAEGAPYPVFYPSQRPHLNALGIEVERDVRDLGRLLEDIAIAWRKSVDSGERGSLERMATSIFTHVVANGWDVGSGLGALHHLGYSMREFYRGLFYLREHWKSIGKAEAVADWVRWYAGSGRIYQPHRVAPSIDTLNTQSQGMVMGILLASKPAAASLYAYRDWISEVLRPREGIVSLFKTDGSVFHHRGHYPAYANGGFEGFSPLIYTLAGSPFAVQEEAYSVLRKALLTHRFAANLRHWPLSIAGRHPTGKWELQAEPFYWIGMGGVNGPDIELLAAYLRLDPQSPHVAELAALGIEPEPTPQGFRFMPYAGLALQRHDNYLVSVRGFSRYLWSHETYRGANHYGRNLASGFLEILHRGDPVNHTASGFSPDGWDWNRLPGTTTRVLPFDELRADIRNLDRDSGFEEMLLSTEAVLGGLSWDASTGLFAQSLRGHAKYDDQLSARKSVFFIDGRILSLGSGISDPGNQYPVETTLWQMTVPPESSGQGNLKLVVDQPIALQSPHGPGFIAYGGGTLRRTRQEQQSPDQRSDLPTYGFFDTAVFEHGVGPVEACYRYAIQLNDDSTALETWAQREAGSSPWVVFHQQDRAVHHVEFSDHKLHGIAVFETSLAIGHSVVQAADAPVLIWAQQGADASLRLRLADPDLRLYDVDGDQFDGAGEQLEVSIYSRPWAANASQAKWITLRLRGHWSAVESNDFSLQLLPDGDTLLSFCSADTSPLDAVLSAVP